LLLRFLTDNVPLQQYSKDKYHHLIKLYGEVVKIETKEAQSIADEMISNYYFTLIF
jgi:hypothetical protein